MRSWIFFCGTLVALYHCCHAQNYFEQCLNESGVAKDKNNINMNDPQLKCFDVCIFKKRGVLKNNKIDSRAYFDALKKGYSGSLSTLKDQVQSCATTANQQSDECDVVNTMKKCISSKVY